MGEEFLAVFRRNRDFFTLIWLIGIILAVPYLETTAFGGLILVGVITVFLLSALYSVSDRPSRVAIGFLLAIPCLLSAWTFLVISTPRIYMALLLSLTVFLVFIIFSVLRKVITAREVTLVELFRAVMVYMMIGLAYGLVFMILETLSPHSFQFTVGEYDPESLIYFSFTALSTAGFGDIVAATPVARTLVTLELLSGVLYLAVLIGFLVNAHYSSRISRPRGEWKEGEFGMIRRFRFPALSAGGPVGILVIAILLDMASSLATIAFGIPLFLDTWGTSFAVIMAGLPIGVLAGVIYNLIMAGTVWELSSVVFIGSSVLVAVMTWWFWTHGWVDVRKPASLVGAGVITGLVNALVVFPLALALNIPPYAGTIGVYERFLGVLGNPVIARLASELVVEPIDKTVCIVLAAIAAMFFTTFFRQEIEHENAVEPEG
jgi:hypothetical protein